MKPEDKSLWKSKNSLKVTIFQWIFRRMYGTCIWINRWKYSNLKAVEIKFLHCKKQTRKDKWNLSSSGMCDFQLLPQCKQDLTSSGMLRSVGWQLVTDLLEWSISHIFKGQVVQAECYLTAEARKMGCPKCW